MLFLLFRPAAKAKGAARLGFAAFSMAAAMDSAAAQPSQPEQPPSQWSPQSHSPRRVMRRMASTASAAMTTGTWAAIGYMCAFAWCVGLMIYQFAGLATGEVAFGPFTALAETRSSRTGPSPTPPS